ncbi:MAG: hypothetical protein CME67_07355 [Halobacteriovoraceae bacterium]|nr:hypothetical protein [Halobacteriovoraceae bacterium]|tara:strand:- start:1855 stop:3876 length:2022 start_codon:yes stop_codon:yes gene_type:complete
MLKGNSKDYIVISLFILAGLCLSLYYFDSRLEMIEELQRENFKNSVNENFESVLDQLEEKRGSLETVSNLFAASEEVSVAEFKTYVGRVLKDRKLSLCWRNNNDEVVASVNNSGVCDVVNILEESQVEGKKDPKLIFSKFISSSGSQKGFISVGFGLSEIHLPKNKLVAEERLIFNRKSSNSFFEYNLNDRNLRVITSALNLDKTRTQTKKVASFNGVDFFYVAQMNQEIQNTALYEKVLLLSLFIFLPFFGFSIYTYFLLRQKDRVSRIVTKRTKALEREIAERRKAQLDAQKHSQIKGEFLANMSHEIRTPLNSIVGLSDLLQESKLDHEQKQHVSVLKNSSEILLNLVNDILDFSKIEAGELVLDEAEVDFHSLFEKIYDIFSWQAKQKGVKLQSNIDEDITATYIGDQSRISQVLINLVGNALKFTSEGEVKFSLIPNQGTKLKGSLLLVVEDTGIGIPEDQQKHIFNKFSQVEDKANRSFGGTGLGLSITSELIRLMGSEIIVESVLGQGSKFYAGLNLEEATSSVKKSKLVSKVDDTKLKESELKVLIVDDAINNRSLVKAYLKKFPFEITEAVDGVEALDKMKEKAFDVVFMDMQMPRMDGYTATEEFRKWESQNRDSCTNIIALTACALKEEKDKSLVSGCDDYLTKPLKKETLINSLNALVDKA